MFCPYEWNIDEVHEMISEIDIYYQGWLKYNNDKEKIMAKVYVFLTEGFELVEALAVVDVLRRASIDVVTVSIMDKKTVMSAQKVEVVADTMFADNDYSKADVLFLPGGPGTKGLEAHEGLVAVLKKHFADGKQLAAICAAPSVFGHLGFLEGKQATCFPGFEGELRGAQFVPERVVCDGNIVTSRGMGTAIDLGLCLVGRLVCDKISGMLAHSIQYK